MKPTTPPPPDLQRPFSPWNFLYALLAAGRASPCAKSKRGVVIFDPRDGAIIAAATNGPAIGRCGGDAACRVACSKICVHAEQAALLDAGIDLHTRRGECEVAHLKVVDGEPVPSGPPSCVECSKLMLTAGIAAVWLLHESPEGGPPQWRRYDADDFHRRTLAHLSLPVTEE